MDSIFTKKYEKVDSFLRRVLSNSRYKGVRLIEPCVVVSDVFNKKFKFAVLANELLYVTENPPKAAKDIQEVTRVVDITSVEIIHDVPEFLRGDLKYRTNHIVVTYKKSNPRGGVTAVELSRNSSPVPLAKSLDEKDFQNSRGKASRQILDQYVSSSEGTSRNSTLSKNLQENDLRKSRGKAILKTSDQNGCPSQKNSRNAASPLSKSLQENQLRYSRRKSSLDFINERENFDELAHSEPRGPPSVESNEEFKTNSKSLHHSFSTVHDFGTSPHPHGLKACAGVADLRATFVRFDPTLETGSDSNLASSKSGFMGTFNGFQNWLSERRSSKAGDKSVGREPASDLPASLTSDEKKECFEIHFYMILDDSVMLAYLRSTWDNCLLSSALKYARKERSVLSSVKSKPKSSQTTALFNQLEKEILNSKSFEVTFDLVHELLTACQKDILIKKLFWRSSDLLVFLVEKIICYINESPKDMALLNRADEIEFLVVLFECLVEMFRETEHLSSRMTRLKNKKHSVFRDLILACITCPKLSKTSKLIEAPDISEAAELLLTGVRRPRMEKREKSAHDIELEGLSNDLVQRQVALLHEVFIVAFQAVWFPSDDKTLNIVWVVKIVESSAAIHSFFQAFVQQVMNITSKAETKSLTSDDTTLLYRLFAVLKTLLQQSSKLRQHIHEHYTEEFRYYVKPHAISNSLSTDCPLTPSTLKLVNDVRHLVTDVSLHVRHLTT